MRGAEAELSFRTPLGESVRMIPTDEVAVTLLPWHSPYHPCRTRWNCAHLGAGEHLGRPAQLYAYDSDLFGTTTVWVDEALGLVLKMDDATRLYALTKLELTAP